VVLPRRLIESAGRDEVCPWGDFESRFEGRSWSEGSWRRELEALLGRVLSGDSGMGRRGEERSPETAGEGRAEKCVFSTYSDTYSRGLQLFIWQGTLGESGYCWIPFLGCWCLPDVFLQVSGAERCYQCTA
jgi:hypothetical protein